MYIYAFVYICIPYAMYGKTIKTNKNSYARPYTNVWINYINLKWNRKKIKLDSHRKHLRNQK